jgi:FKBP-type peptidyl-prolyl cis-trans isomerase FkpA
MRRIIWLLAIITVALVSCHSGNNPSVPFDAGKQAAKDDSIIRQYIKKNNIPAVKDASGLYYQIIKPGSGATATETSTIQVNYEGRMTDGSVFDKTGGQPVSFGLNAVIPGWTKGIPLIKVGGKILLIIPSALGYGNNAAGPIPENSVLVFTIDLLNVK